MRKKFPSITNWIAPGIAIILILTFWQLMCMAEILPTYMLPSPKQVLIALQGDFPLLMEHSVVTLQEAFLGLFIGVAGGFLLAAWMEECHILYQALYPVLVITQTIPTVAIAPLLVLWLGYGIAPKVTLVVIVTFFPIAVNLLDGFQEADPDAIRLLQAMGASRWQIFWHIKVPSSLSHFFGGLRIAVSYAIVGAVISEWLGGFSGLGVYMTRVKKSYAYDKMFAVIFLITVLSLILMKVIRILQQLVMPWNRKNKIEMRKKS